MAVTNKSIFLDHQRQKLGIPGRVERDQQAQAYVLVGAAGTEAIGSRWRDALAALRARGAGSGARPRRRG